MPAAALLVMPSARAVPVEGGFRLTGRWAFASGVHHAEWVAAQALMTVDDDAPPVLHMLVFPAAAVELHDNWQVLGLRGTGRCDISVSDLFVPAAMAWNVRASRRSAAARCTASAFRLSLPMSTRPSRPAWRGGRSMR